MRPHIVDFSRLLDLKALAVALSCDQRTLAARLNDNRGQLRQHQIPKKNPKRGTRAVWEVEDIALRDGLATLLRLLHSYLQNLGRGYPHPSAHGYVPGHSTLTNARPHIGAAALLTADIRDFFPSIGTARVQAVLQGMDVRPPVAQIIAELSSVGGRLALGLATSPMLANLVSLNLDIRLMTLANELGCNYTRYADDLAFSAPTIDSLPSRIQVRSALRAEGFSLAEHKFKLRKRGQAFFVTGLSVSEDDRPRVPKRFKRQLRQELYFIGKYGLFGHLEQKGYQTYQSGINKVFGRIQYLRGIEPRLGRTSHEQFKAQLTIAGVAPTYGPQFQRNPRQVDLYIDEAEIGTSAGSVLAVALVAVEEPAIVRERLSELAMRLFADPYITGSAAKIAKKGLHFVDLSEDSRSELVKAVALLPVRAFVAYRLYDGSVSDYVSTYLAMLADLLRFRFVNYDRCGLRVVVEQNSKIKESWLQACGADVYGELAAADSRRPRSPPKVEVVAKLDEPCVALPDCLLGVFQAYATSDLLEHRQLVVTRFERLRPKFIMIRDWCNQLVFTRRRDPFQPWQGGTPVSAAPAPLADAGNDVASGTDVKPGSSR